MMTHYRLHRGKKAVIPGGARSELPGSYVGKLLDSRLVLESYPARMKVISHQVGAEDCHDHLSDLYSSGKLRPINAPIAQTQVGKRGFRYSF